MKNYNFLFTKIFTNTYYSFHIKKYFLKICYLRLKIVNYVLRILSKNFSVKIFRLYIGLFMQLEVLLNVNIEFDCDKNINCIIQLSVKVEKYSICASHVFFIQGHLLSCFFYPCDEMSLNGLKVMDLTRIFSVSLCIITTC